MISVRTRSNETVYTSAKVRLTSDAIRIPDPIATKFFNHLLTGPLPTTTFSEKFMQIHSEVFAQSC